MSAVNDIGALLGTGAPATAQSQKLPGTMGKEDFLMLLVEQLKAQDPLNPKDPSEFTSQLAQFSSLEQMFNIGDTLMGLTALTASLNNAQAASFLGREVEVSGATSLVRSGSATGMHYSLPDAAASATLKIYDENGALCRTVELGSQTEGDHEYAWDGKNDEGAAVGDGTYTFSIEAKDAAGDDLNVRTFRRGVVTGITYDNGITLLEINGQRIPVTDILSVRIQDTTE